MNWKSLKIYFDRRHLAIAILGISSGLPLALTMSTLSIWLAEAGINKATIGALALVGLPYSLKFLWAPIIDHLSIPVLNSLLGKRRSWMIVTQVFLGAAIFLMGRFDPKVDIVALSLLAVAVAFFSASQDIVVDAFRIESLDEKTYASGAAIFIFGYRIGLIISGAGALFLASTMPWDTVYAIMGLCIGVGILTALLCKEPDQSFKVASQISLSLFVRIKNMTVGPFLDFMEKPQWLMILFFVIFYKLGDAYLGNMVNPFYLDMGFTKIEIAGVTKIFGLIATLMGGFAGGILVFRVGMLRGLLICGVLQLASNLVFAVLALLGHNLPFLAFTIGVENFTSAMGNAAFMAYLSSLCSLSFTASQYALLSALAATGRTFFSASAGILAEATTWPLFFIISSVVALPGILALLWLMRIKVQARTPLETIRTT